MPRRPPRTVLELAVGQLGVHRGGFAAARVAQWAMCTHALGHVPTTVEYADYWAITERNGWKHRADVRAVLGDDWPEVVERLAGLLDGRMSERDVLLLALPA